MQINTFQVVLATDGNLSFVICLYAEVQWGSGAQIGFNAGDGMNSFMTPAALTSATVDVDGSSNVGETGIYAFRVDQEAIEEPPSASGDYVTLQFEQGRYCVVEGEGEIEVCIIITDGVLVDDLLLQLYTVSDSATRKFYSCFYLFW